MFTTHANANGTVDLFFSGRFLETCADRSDAHQAETAWRDEFRDGACCPGAATERAEAADGVS